MLVDIKLSGKQIHTLKKLLPTVKLNAYDIETYQQILRILDNAKSPNYNSKTKKKSSTPLIDDPSTYPSNNKQNHPKISNIKVRQVVDKNDEGTEKFIERNMFED